MKNRLNVKDQAVLLCVYAKAKVKIDILSFSSTGLSYLMSPNSVYNAHEKFREVID